MLGSDDIILLKQYVEGDETAFAALVGRYINLVYSAALRQISNPSQAEEITQAVFIILTRKAKSLGPNTILSGWLYQTARLTAANYQRSEYRRQQREQEAYMQSTLSGPESASWEHIAPLLDEAMGRLSQADRNAIVLRFFENKTSGEVAATLNLSEITARKRVSRAVEKLRKFFSRRGVILPLAALTTVISTNSVQAAPAGLAATISATALKGAAVAGTVTTLVKGTLKIMTYAKIKLAVYISTAILLAGGATTIVLSGTAAGDTPSPGEIFKLARDKYASLTSYSDAGQSVATLNGITINHTFNIKLARPSLYRIEWEQHTDSAISSTTIKPEAVWSDGTGDFLDMGLGVKKLTSRDEALSSATGISGNAAATIPGTFFKMNWGNQLGGPTAGYKTLPDEKVGDVDCYVLAAELKKGITRTLWIGKQDSLIHQVRNVTSAEALKAALAHAAELHPEITVPHIASTGVSSTETHANIVLNPPLSAKDFAR